MRLILEPRQLFDASLARAAHGVFDPHHWTSLPARPAAASSPTAQPRAVEAAVPAPPRAPASIRSELSLFGDPARWSDHPARNIGAADLIRTSPPSLAKAATPALKPVPQNQAERPLPTVSFDPKTVPTDALLGNTFTETLNFSNAASTSVGYGPFIDVFAQNDPAEKVSLKSASFDGLSVQTTAVTLSANVPGHVGTLGALHPLAVGADGLPLFVDAPAGFVAGDTMYVLRLPFGSFTPGQPAAGINLTWSVDKTGELTSVHPAAAMTIAAVGGFMFGADALNNPAVDPSLRGTSTAEGPAATDIGNGAVVQALPVTLLDFQTRIDTYPGEGETATGPDFVGNYIITLTPANATSGDPLTGLEMRIVLPGDVQYTGGQVIVDGVAATSVFVPAKTAQGGEIDVTLPTIADTGTPVVIHVPVFVPRTDASGSAILDPVTGAPAAILAPSISYSGGQWSPWAGSVDHGTPAQVSGAAAPGTPLFTAKSLAVQNTGIDITTGNNSGIANPGDLVAFTIRFQVSDYFALDNLQLQSIIGDGMTLDPSMGPVLSVSDQGHTSQVQLGSIGNGQSATVNGQAVATSGTAADWNFSRDNAATGLTTVNFSAGGALAAALGSSILHAGATGSITIYARVLDKYTRTNIDPSTGLPGFITERDQVLESASGNGTLLNTDLTPTQASPVTVSDQGSLAAFAPAQGTLGLTIAAINGVAVTGPVAIQAGDTVTYKMDYNLVTGDYGNLALTAFLPLPVLDAANPLANGGNATLFSSDTVDATPAAGTYSLVGAPNGVSVQSATVNGTANSIAFDFGHRDDPTNTPATVSVLFSVKATSAAFADGLLLTSEAQSSFTDTHQVVLGTTAINQVTLQEPNLVAKTGVVSVAGDAGQPKSLPFINQIDGSLQNPSGQFSAAGTSGSPFAGPIPTSIGSIENLDVSGIDAGDTARIVTSVQNTGGAPNGAFDVTLSGALAAGYTAANVTGFQVVRGDGTVMSFTRPDGSAASAADYLGPVGIKVSSPEGASAPGLYSKGDSLNRDMLFVVYDLHVNADLKAGSSLKLSGDIVNWAAVPGGVASGVGFVSGGTPVGGAATDIADNATLKAQTPGLTKGYAPSDIPADDGVDPSAPGATVVVGETRPLTIDVSVPEGSLTNNGGHVLVTDTLAPGEVFTGLTAVSTSGVNGLPLVTASVNGNVVTFDLGPQVTGISQDAPGDIKLSFNVKFADGANRDGQSLTDTAALVYDGAPVPQRSTTFVQHDPHLAATIKDTSGGNPFSGQTVDYTYTVTNTGLVDSFSTAGTLDLPAGLTYVGGSLTHVSGGASGALNDGNPVALTVSPGLLAPGESAVYTFKAVVQPNLPSGTNLTVISPQSGNIGYSAPSAGRSVTFTASDPLQVAQFSPVLAINGEANGSDPFHTSQTNPYDKAGVTPGDIVGLHGYVQVPEGSTPSVVLDFAIPAGMKADAGSFRLALVSPGGDLSSSVLDPAGNGQWQVTEPVSGFNPATFAAGAALPLSALDFSTPGHVLINLGTITNNDGSALPNYIIVEFNGQVLNLAGNAAGGTLYEKLSVLGHDSIYVGERIQEPSLALSKTVTSVDQAAGTVTYTLTLTNKGGAIAYGVDLRDLLGQNEGSITGYSASGPGSGFNLVSATGTNDFHVTLDSLAAGQAWTFVYTANVTDPSKPVGSTTATAVWRDLQTLTETFRGTSTGSAGSVTGTRDGSGGLGGSPDGYVAQASAGLGTISGRIFDALGNNPSVFDPLLDTGLGGISLTLTAAGGIVEHTVTAGDGTYSFGLVPQGSFNISFVGPGGQTMVYNAHGNVANGSASETGVGDGTAQSGFDASYEKPDTAPVLGSWSSGVIQASHGAYTNLGNTGATTVLDTELGVLIAANEGYSYAGTVLRIERYVGNSAAPNIADSFITVGSVAMQAQGSGSGQLSINGRVIGSYTEAAGVYTVTFGAGSSSADVQAVLNGTQFQTAGSDLQLGVRIGATLSDGNTGAQGTGGQMVSAPVFSILDVLPSTSPTVVFTEPNNSPAIGQAVGLGPVALQDLFAPGATLASAVVSLAGSSPSDVLLFTPDAGSGDIGAAFSNGVLTLTSAGGAATTAQWQDALSHISFYTSSTTPATDDRVATLTLADASTGDTSASTLAVIKVVATDNSPILVPTAPLTVNPSTEDVSGSPTGATGTLVSGLVGIAGQPGPGDVTDPDGANAHDGQIPGYTGMAIIAADTSIGNWWYSTNGGATWTEFAGAGLTAISATNALHLFADANTRIYFQPTTANWNGQIPDALTFRAWDGSDAAANGSLAALPTDSAFGTGINTGAAAYSAATAQISMIVRAVNDAPVATGSAVAPTVSEDVTAPAGATVGALFAGNFSDTVDQQMSSANPAGSVANTLAGVAVTLDATPVSAGVWRYSTDGGATWISITQGSLSDGSALVLSASDRISFLPGVNYNGVPPGLTVRLIDSSTDVPVSTGVTGADVAAGSLALSGIDVSGAHDGGSTAISAATVGLSIDVVAINDAPIASGSATLPGLPEGSGIAPGSMVSDLFAGNFSDTVDGQQSPGNPLGSVANTLAGIAITGDAATSTQGVWRYSVDGGTTWVAIDGSTLSDGSSLVLSASAKLSFLPAPGFNGQPGGLTVRLIDTSTDVPVSGLLTGLALSQGTLALTGVDVSGVHDGGISAVSGASVPLETTVSAVHAAPSAGGVAGEIGAEDTAPQAYTVGGLLSQGSVTYSDAANQVTAPSVGGTSAQPAAGIAIVGDNADPATGAWRYSTDGGQTWEAVPVTGLSDTHAVVLSTGDLLEFVSAANFNGIPGGLVARVSDGTGFTGSGLSDISVGVGGSGGWSAGTFSIGSAIAAVNDAPIASGGTILVPVSEDASGPPGSTVSELFAGNFSDTVDLQRSSSNPMGSLANTLAGIAITGDAATAAQGTWRYSLDGGTTWTAIDPATVSDATALLLPGTARLSFLPTVNFNGVPGSLTTRLIDSSTDVTLTGSLTGADLAASGRAFTGVDVSGARDGGDTAVSLGTVDLSTSIKAVNNAPLASGAATLPSTEDVSGSGASVGSLLGQSGVTYSDATDTVTVAVSGGSTGTPFAGLAITADNSDPATGSWQYSTDGGKNWTSVAAGSLSPANALVLSNTDLIRFVGAPNYNGVPGGLVAHASDGTSLPASGYQDVSGQIGGTGGFSADPVTIGTSVAAVNDAPLASGKATLPTSTGGNPVAGSVSGLFGPLFSDTVDQQHSATDLNGSVANTLAGIAVTGDGALPTQGIWRYSLDGGKTWTGIDPATLSQTTALVLPGSGLLSFLPAKGYDGTPGGLTVRLIDGSFDVPLVPGLTGASLAGGGSAYVGVDVSGIHNGGSAAVSAGTVDLTTDVTGNVLPPPPPPSPIPTPQPQRPVTPALTPAREARLPDGGMPQDWLVGEPAWHFVLAEQRASFSLSAGTFLDSDPAAPLDLRAASADGSPLPPWLTFDPVMATFSGTPPLKAAGTLDLVVEATDRHGHKAESEVHIVIGREPKDLLGLLAAPPTESRLLSAVRGQPTHRHAPTHHRTKVAVRHGFTKQVAIRHGGGLLAALLGKLSG